MSKQIVNWAGKADQDAERLNWIKSSRAQRAFSVKVKMKQKEEEKKDNKIWQSKPKLLKNEIASERGNEWCAKVVADYI